MSDIYIYERDCEDFSTQGLVGALTPSEVTFSESANGESELEIVHPLDAEKRYTAFVQDRIIVAYVPVRTTVDVQVAGASKEKYTVETRSLLKGLTKSARILYKKETKTSKLADLPASGGTYTVVGHYIKGTDEKTERYKCVTPKGTGWISASSLSEAKIKVIDPTAGQRFDDTAPSWSITPQLFRIYSVNKSLDGIEVNARHISYDLLGNLTTYKSGTGEYSLETVLTGILSKCAVPHEFEAFTDSGDTRADIDFTNWNPIKAILDPEAGVAARYNVGLVRNNYDLYFLHEAGVNRGVSIEYGKNLLGVSCKISTDDVATRIIPTGEEKDGKLLYLKDTKVIDGVSTTVNYVDDEENISKYSAPHVYVLACDDCKMSGTKEDERTRMRDRMRQAAKDLIADGCGQPRIEMSVKFVNLGDTEEYAQYKGLENVFLFDFVRIYHKGLDINATARVVLIKWNCLLDRMDSCEIGELGATLADSGISTWQVPSGFSGSKIGTGSITAAALGDDIINARHVQAGTITADKLNAQDIFADNAEIGDLLSNKIQTTELSADNIKTGTLDAERITVNTLEAKMVVLKDSNNQVETTLEKFAFDTAATANSASTEVAKAVKKSELATVVDSDANGVSLVGDTGKKTGVAPKSDSVDLMLNGEQAATVAQGYAQFGALVVRVVNGCLCFSLDSSKVEGGEE